MRPGVYHNPTTDCERTTEVNGYTVATAWRLMWLRGEASESGLCWEPVSWAWSAYA